MNTIVQIAPQLPPAMDGVGDYAWRLWKHWPDNETQFNFIVLHGGEATRAIDLVQLENISPNHRALHAALDRSSARTAILHYVGYAYQPKGMPLWLPSALEWWRNEGSGRRLITMFHEMYATSSPLRSPFWVKPFARHIMQRLVNTSDAWVTSCSRYFNWLVDEFHAQPARGTLLPIAPNVPAALESDEVRLWPLEFGRKLRVAIFGLPKTRLDALQRHRALLSALVRDELVESISLIGKIDLSPRYTKKLRELQRAIGGEWRAQFDLPPVQVAETLAACDIGCVANDTGTLTKSGVFAALAANGVVCIAADRQGASLHAPFGDCVMLNDDSAPAIDALVAELRNNDHMSARRKSTQQAAKTALSWSRIASTWHGVVTGAGVSTERTAATAASSVNRPAPLAEVRA